MYTTEIKIKLSSMTVLRGSFLAFFWRVQSNTHTRFSYFSSSFALPFKAAPALSGADLFWGLDGTPSCGAKASTRLLFTET